MVFGSRKQHSPETAQTETAPEPAQQLADAEAALSAVQDEQATVQQTLLEHQQQREAVLRDGGDLAQVVQLDRAAYQLGLRLQQLELLRPARHAAVRQAHVAVHEANWRDFRPTLVEAEQRLATAISEIYSALAEVQAAHDRAHRAGFADRLGEFHPPVPKDPLNDWSLRQYAKFAERRQQTAA